MVSLKHEGVLELVRDRPAFAADLLGELLAVEVPRFTRAHCVDVTLNQVAPAEYRADAVVLFTRRKPVFGVIIEAQLRPKKEKRFTWPLYAVGARAREKCPFVVLVVAPNAATARWAARPIELGGGNHYTPLVVGPDGVPKLTDPARARREPQLAVLSVMAHGRGEVMTAAAIGAAAAKAILRLSEEQRVLYSLLIEANLSDAARKAIEMQPGLEKFFSKAQRRNFERGLAQGEAKGKAEGKAEGRAEGQAAALLKILTRRGLTPTGEQRRHIMGCTDVAMLERWLDGALSVSSVAELLAPHARTRRSAHRSRAAAPNGRRKAALK
ncbi:MAG TPA: hypothetical protein VGD37_12905 [Kofleriaceae bacterium]